MDMCCFFEGIYIEVIEFFNEVVSMIERQVTFNEIRNIITTKSTSDWDYIVRETKKMYDKDISSAIPVFLTPSDFEKTNKIFDPGLIFLEWFKYNKIPVLMIKNVEELENAIGKALCFEFFNSSHFIK